jgi:hypothetical protein
MRFFFFALVITLNLSFLHSAEPSFKFTFGGNLGNLPIEINKMSKDTKIQSGININSWIVSPNFLPFVVDKKKSNFLDNKDSKENFYIKFNFKF